MKVDLAIGHWQLGIWAYGTHRNDMLEWPPNNIFPVHNSNAYSNLHWISYVCNVVTTFGLRQKYYCVTKVKHIRRTALQYVTRQFGISFNFAHFLHLTFPPTINRDVSVFVSFCFRLVELLNVAFVFSLLATQWLVQTGFRCCSKLWEGEKFW